MNKSLSEQLVDSQLQLKTVLEEIFLNIYTYMIATCIGFLVASCCFSFDIISSFQLSY